MIVLRLTAIAMIAVLAFIVCSLVAMLVMGPEQFVRLASAHSVPRVSSRVGWTVFFVGETCVLSGVLYSSRHSRHSFLWETLNSVLPWVGLAWIFFCAALVNGMWLLSLQVAMFLLVIFDFNVCPHCKHKQLSLLHSHSSYCAHCNQELDQCSISLKGFIFTSLAGSFGMLFFFSVLVYDPWLAVIVLRDSIPHTSSELVVADPGHRWVVTDRREIEKLFSILAAVRPVPPHHSHAIRYVSVAPAGMNNAFCLSPDSNTPTKYWFQVRSAADVSCDPNTARVEGIISAPGIGVWFREHLPQVFNADRAQR